MPLIVVPIADISKSVNVDDSQPGTEGRQAKNLIQIASRCVHKVSMLPSCFCICFFKTSKLNGGKGLETL